MSFYLTGNSGDEYNVNISGWSFFRELIEQLGFDSVYISQTNDGEIDRAHAIKYGESILRALKDNKIMLERSSTKAARYSKKGYTEKPYVGPDSEADYVTALISGNYIPLSQEDKSWLEEFANFCIASDGFSIS